MRPLYRALVEQGQQTRAFLDEIWGDQVGWACITHKRPVGMIDTYFMWPEQRNDLLAHVERVKGGGDTWFTPLLRSAKERKKATSAPGHYCWVDIDDPEKALGWDWVDQYHAIVVDSGTPGHLHYYIRLNATVPAVQIEALNKALARKVGGDPAPTHAGALMRLPDTFNHKPIDPSHPEFRKIPKGPRPVVMLSSPDGFDGFAPATLMTRWGAAEKTNDQRVHEFTDAQAQAYIDRALDKLRQAGEGSRNPQLNSTAMEIGHFVPAYFDQDQAIAVLTDAADECGIWGDDGDVQCLATMRSGLEAGQTSWLAQRPREDDSGEPGRGPRLANLPDDFWEQRKVLQHIREAAWSEGRAADLVLMAVLARLSSMIPPDLRLRNSVGVSPLNLFVAPVGDSGTGKTTGARSAAELLPLPPFLDGPADDEQDLFLDGVPLGSGEGIPEAFYGDVGEENEKGQTKRVRKIVRSNAFFAVDEGETFAKMLERNGATVGATLRSAWNGATLGQMNARAETRRVVKEGTYSVGLLMGFQRTTAQVLLDDVGPGTPQRFLWCSATDPKVPEDDAPLHPGLLPNVLGTDTTVGPRGEITFVPELNREIRRKHIQKIRGNITTEPHNSQEPLIRCKVAALMALLDNGRRVVTEEDWALADVIWRTSCAVRDSVIEFGIEQRTKKRVAHRQEQVEIAEAVHDATAGREEKIARVAANIVRKVETKGPMTRGFIRQGIHARDRDTFDDAFDRVMETGQLVEAAGKLTTP